MMKKTILFWVALFMQATCFSQQYVIKDVLFNNYTSSTNNDLTNLFFPTSNYRQIADSGITGGSVRVADDYADFYFYDGSMAVYNDSFKLFTNLDAAVCFRFIDAESEFEVGILMKPHTLDPYTGEFYQTYDYSLATFEKDDLGYWSINFTSALGGTAYSASISSSLIPGNWYRLAASFWGTVYLYDLGSTGTSNPVLLTSLQGSTSFPADNVDYNDAVDYARVCFGASSQSLVYFDNFQVGGYLINSDSSTEVSNVKESLFTMQNIVNNNLSLDISKIGHCNYEIYDISGRILKSGTLQGNSTIDIDKLSSGSYFLRLTLKGGRRLVRRFQKI